MCETPDCWDVLGNKIQDWIDSADVPPGLESTMGAYRELAKVIRRNLPPSYERHVALRKLLDSQNWVGRIPLGYVSERHDEDMNELAPCINSDRCFAKANSNLAAVYWIAFERLISSSFTTSAKVQAARLLLESRDAAVQACLEMLAEQQKQELRVVSQST